MRIAGAVLWVLVAQHFVMLVVVQSAWTTPYSWLSNAVSDLGAATCFTGPIGYVCSPWHTAAEVAWVVEALSLILGALLLAPSFPRRRLVTVAIGAYVVTGLGILIAGVNPEDVATVPHVLSATTSLVAGVTASLLIGIALLRAGRRTVGALALVASVVATLGVVVMFAQVGGPALFGLWERVAGFPILIWAVVAGAVELADALRDRRASTAG